MHRHLSVLVIVFVCCVTAVFSAQQFRGQVVNRDGVAQRCQVEFFIGSNFMFGVATNNQGYFYVNNPRLTSYRVVVSQGQARNEFQVSIDQYGLHPSTLVVRW